MKYENTKSLTDLIDKIVLSESEELAKKIKSLEESNTRLRNDIIEKNKEISQYRDRNEELSRHIEIIKKYEQDTGRYYKAEPQYEYQGDEFGNGDMGLCGINVIEITKEEKYPEPTQTQKKQGIESEEMPF